MRKRDALPKIYRFWILGWVIIFGLILFLSIYRPEGQAVTLTKLGGIVFCLFYVAWRFPKDYLLLGAMLLTSVADIILAGDNISPFGVMVFLVVQLLHLLRMSQWRLWLMAAIYFGVAAAALVIDMIFNFVPLLFVAVVPYATVLITNVVVAAAWHRREPTNLQARFAIGGFVTFLCCDFCTMLSYLALIGVLPQFTYAPANFFVWLFYYPSQILIANSGKCDTIVQKEGNS